MRLRSALAAAALASAAAALTACASPDRSIPLRAFTEGRLGDARAFYEQSLGEDADLEALDHNEAGTVALVQGDVAAAQRHFKEAYDVMEDLTSTTGETISATLGSESSKTWKGDPFERCMNAYYLGVTYWMQGDPDNAAACFKSGLLRDADSEKGDAQSDFAVLWYLLGMAQRDAHHEDGGEAALKKAHALLPANPSLDPRRALDANVLLVLDLGLGPKKVATGAHGSDLRFQPRPYRAAFADVTADGAAVGRTARAVDVYQQAITRGDKVIDHFNKGKAIFKDAAVIGGAIVLDNSGSTSSDVIGAALILAGILASAEADTRQWDTLPGEVQVLAAKLAPGEHELRIDIRDRGGAPIPEQSRTLRVTVAEGRTTLAWARAVPAGQEGRPSGKMRPRRQR